MPEATPNPPAPADIADPDLPVDRSEIQPAAKPAVHSTQERLIPPKSKPDMDVPNPFRPSDLGKMLSEFKKKHKIPDGDLRLKPHRFLKDHGLPNPKRRIAVQGYIGEVFFPVLEFEADDVVDAKRQYNESPSINLKPGDAHKMRHDAVIREE